MFGSFFDIFKSLPHFEDPVCGMRTSDKIKLERSGKTYYFCSEECQKKFDLDPNKYRGDDERDD